MADFSKDKLSGSTNGRQIKVAATASPGTLIHTAIAGIVDWDEVWLYATNNHTAAVVLTLQWGGTTNPDDNIAMSIPAKTGLYLLIPGMILQNGLILRAYAATANVISVGGWVNRIAA